MTTPADELRTAAEKLRALASAATPGPWEGVVDDHGRGEVDASIWADSISYYVTEKISSGGRHKADAHYIATMHPGVGTALADWLDSEADHGLNIDPAALTVARRINAGGQP